VFHPQRLKAGTEEPKETVIVRQRFGKHVPAVTNGITEEVGSSVFYAVRVVSTTTYVVKVK
jgi:hypothetical protein